MRYPYCVETTGDISILPAIGLVTQTITRYWFSSWEEAQTWKSKQCRPEIWDVQVPQKPLVL